MECMRKMLASKIHRATVTETDIDYEGSITLSPALIAAADLIPYEAVQIWNITSGTRFETYVIAGNEDAHICINGAAAHLAKPGDLIIISRFIWLDEAASKSFQPKIVKVDSENKITEVSCNQSVPIKRA